MTASPTRSLDDVPDAPGGWPLVGHLVALGRDLPGVFRAAARTGGLQRLRLPFGADIVLWPSTESLSLLSRRDVSASEAARVGEVIVGRTSMLSADGLDHRRRRKAASAAFSPRGLAASGVGVIVREIVERRVAGMLRRGSVRMLLETQSLSLEILFRILGVPGDEVDAWAQRYTVMVRSVAGPAWNLPGLPYRRALRARKWVDERLGRYVGQARRDPDMTGLVAELVRGMNEDGAGLDEVELLDNLRLMVLAGHETTASVMAWMVAYLSRFPEHHERLRGEARAHETLPETDRELEAYPFAEAFFRECLRLHPPAVLATRTTTAPMTVAGFDIPVGTLLGVPLWLFGRDPEAFPEPDRFVPTRWIRDERSFSALETSAFGAGPHFCVGYHLARIEAVQFLVALVRAMDDRAVRPTMRGLPRETYLPLLRPRVGDTHCRFVRV